MPDKHARLSASASDRWIHCPASVHLSEEYGPKEEETSIYAEEGTRAHALAEYKLKSRLLKQRGKKPACDDAEMDEATDYYCEAVKEILEGAGEGARLLVEQQYSLEPYIPEGFGTSDAVVIADDTMHVIDLKYGQGVMVNAEGNSQLRSYALGTLTLFDGLYEVETVITHIIQPRLKHSSSETISVADLTAWGENVLKPAAEKAWNNSDEANPGDWCRFCPFRAICRAREVHSVETARQEFSAATEAGALTLDELGRAMEAAEKLKAWLDDAKTYALEKAMSGQKIPGWKVVEGRSVRKYSDELAVMQRLEEAGYPRAITTETRVLGISAMEKAVGKKKLTEICGDLIIKPQGKPTLVPESDKRPAMNSAEEDFKEEK